MVEGGEVSRARRLFDESRVANRWSGQKEAADSDKKLNRDEITREIQRNNAGFGWREGPPILGDGEGELPLEKAHIGGRIFGEDIFAAAGFGSDDDAAAAVRSGGGEDEGEDDGDEWGFFS